MVLSVVGKGRVCVGGVVPRPSTPTPNCVFGSVNKKAVFKKSPSIVSIVESPISNSAFSMIIDPRFSLS